MIICLSGKIESGKDLVGKIIQHQIAGSKDPSVLTIPLDEWNDNCEDLEKISGFTNKRFNDKLKDIVCLLLGCTRTQLENRTFKESPLSEEWVLTDDMLIDMGKLRPKILTPRILLQVLGTDCGRNIIHPNIWVNALFAGYKQSPSRISSHGFDEYGFPNWIITDARFPNDDDYVKKLGGLRIRVERPTESRNNTHDGHSSETALDHITDFDETIQNSGSVDMLVTKVRDILISRKII